MIAEGKKTPPSSKASTATVAAAATTTAAMAMNHLNKTMENAEILVSLWFSITCFPWDFHLRNSDVNTRFPKLSVRNNIARCLHVYVNVSVHKVSYELDDVLTAGTCYILFTILFAHYSYTHCFSIQFVSPLFHLLMLMLTLMFMFMFVFLFSACLMLSLSFLICRPLKSAINKLNPFFE